MNELYKVGGHRYDPEGIDYNPFHVSLLGTSPLPGEADLRKFSAQRHNQGNTSSCVANATIKAVEIKRAQKNGTAPYVPLSVLDLYYGARDLMNPSETNMDSGTFISLACEVLKRFGVCRSEEFPFIDNNLFIPPSILATRESYLNKITNCFRINSIGPDRINDVIAALCAGHPVVFGTQVGTNWFNYTADSQPLGPTDPLEVKGGHATCLVGWVNDLFITENSWGPGFGDNGFAWLQPEVLLDPRANDFWIVQEGSDLHHEGK